jgi:hypothetical protein
VKADKECFKHQLQKMKDVKQIAASAHCFLEELYGGPKSYQVLLLENQGLLDADMPA